MPRPKVTRAQALAWRLRRQHLLDGAADPVEVVRTLGMLAIFGSDPDLAVRRRLASPGPPGEVQRALDEGRLLRTWARGAVSLMEPATAGRFLVIRAAGRQWARKSWVEFYDLQPDDWPDLREIVRGVVADGPVPPQAVADELARSRRFAHLAPQFAEPNITLLKPFSWQGDIVLGPGLDGPMLLQSPEATRGWRGLPDLDEAGRAAVLDYFAAYGPATRADVHHWLGDGLSAGRSRVERWLDDVTDRLVEVDVDGEKVWHAGDLVDQLLETEPAGRVVMLPGKDAWVFGPGTKHTWVVPPATRQDMTRGAAPIVVDGVVSGTWRVGDDTLHTAWLDEPSATVAKAYDAEVARLSALVGHELTPSG